MSEITDDRLRPCPFCGCAPQPVPQNSSIPFNKDWRVFVWCENCNAQGPLRDTDAEAIAAWNRRAAASTSTEGAGVIEALRTLTSAVENMRVPQNIAEAAMQVELTIGPALRSAQDVLRALTPPASKVTTQERNA